MFLEKLNLLNFKNHSDSTFTFVERISSIVGPNGIGKTNVLDAIHYLSMCKSYLNAIDKQNVKFNESFFHIHGSFNQENDVNNEISCTVKIGQKKIIKKNKISYEKFSDHIGYFPSVIISPYDKDLISEGSDVRRKWMDGIIAQSNPIYLEKLIKYNKVLDQRNALLKQFYENGFFQRESIEIWDAQLIELGSNIHQIRTEFINSFTPFFNSFYTFISEENELVQLTYKSALNEQTFESILKQNHKKDANYQYTTEGIHKDDILFTIHQHPIKKFGSQGQQKSFLIALKLAQFEWIKQHLGKIPILLLDDIFDKLDPNRVSKILSLVAKDDFHQVIITDTDGARLESLFSEVNIPFQLIQLNNSYERV